jgi:transcriptional regulator with XRE-family HTH domain
MANLSIIRQLCVDNKITQKELAQRVGISHNGLQNIMKTGSAKIDTLEKIAEIFGTSILVFFREKEVEPVSENSVTYFPFGLLNFDSLRFMANRYDKISDKINFLKDYYIWEFLFNLQNKKIPIFFFDYPGYPYLVVGKDSLYKLADILNNTPITIDLPYSRMETKLKQAIDSSDHLIEVFYLSLMIFNVFNITDYLSDEVLLDEELQKYWIVYKSFDLEKIKFRDMPKCSMIKSNDIRIEYY